MLKEAFANAPAGFQDMKEIEKTMSFLENSMDRLDKSFNKLVKFTSPIIQLL